MHHLSSEINKDPVFLKECLRNMKFLHCAFLQSVQKHDSPWRKEGKNEGYTLEGLYLFMVEILI